MNVCTRFSVKFINRIEDGHRKERVPHVSPEQLAQLKCECFCFVCLFFACVSLSAWGFCLCISMIQTRRNGGRQMKYFFFCFFFQLQLSVFSLFCSSVYEWLQPCSCVSFGALAGGWGGREEEKGTQ